MRESVRLYLKENNSLNKYMSIIFTGHTGALNKSFAEIDFAIKKIIEEIL